METPHYLIRSTATQAQTRRMGDAVEALHRAYARTFALSPDPESKRLELVLYGDRVQFRRDNRGPAWAEAYYRTPRCHAYFDRTASNPHHWMLHEATHQLQREVSRFPRRRWLDEGLASYFGSGRLDRGSLDPSTPDPNAYPIWHLHRMALTGDMDRDIESGAFIPLRALVTGVDAPPLDTHVNAYYLHWWSLAHYLMHGDHGAHAEGYRRLLGEGGSLEAFERLVAPVGEIQPRWYAHLWRQVERERARRAH